MVAKLLRVLLALAVAVQMNVCLCGHPGDCSAPGADNPKSASRPCGCGHPEAGAPETPAPQKGCCCAGLTASSPARDLPVSAELPAAPDAFVSAGQAALSVSFAEPAAIRASAFLDTGPPPNSAPPLYILNQSFLI